MNEKRLKDVVLQALQRRELKSKVLIHSDQGSQFTSMDWAASRA